MEIIWKYIICDHDLGQMLIADITITFAMHRTMQSTNSPFPHFFPPLPYLKQKLKGTHLKSIRLKCTKIEIKKKNPTLHFPLKKLCSM